MQRLHRFLNGYIGLLLVLLLPAAPLGLVLGGPLRLRLFARLFFGGLLRLFGRRSLFLRLCLRFLTCGLSLRLGFSFRFRLRSLRIGVLDALLSCLVRRFGLILGVGFGGVSCESLAAG